MEIIRTIWFSIQQGCTPSTEAPLPPKHPFHRSTPSTEALLPPKHYSIKTMLNFAERSLRVVSIEINYISKITFKCLQKRSKQVVCLVYLKINPCKIQDFTCKWEIKYIKENVPISFQIPSARVGKGTTVYSR